MTAGLKIDLENSPWALVLLVALVCLVLMTLVLVILVSLGVQGAATPILGAMGVWSGIVLTSLTVGMARARRNGNGGNDA